MPIEVVEAFILENYPAVYQILNIYLFGSRLYGTDTPDSDWDFLVVVDGPYFTGPKLVEKGDLNTTLLHKNYFQYL